MTQNAKPIFLWDNLMARSGYFLTATSSESGHPVSNLADWREYLTWKAGSGASQDLKVDCGSGNPQTATAIVIYGHNLYSAGKTKATLYGSNDNTNWTKIVEHSISSNDVIAKFFGQTTWRYYKVNVDASNDAAEIALLFIGNYLEFPGWPASGFDPNQKETVTESARSEQGYLLGAVTKFQRRKIQLNFNYLTDSFIRNIFLAFWSAHIPKPFLFAWDKDNHALETYLVEVVEPKLEAPYEPAYRSLKLELAGKVV
jgi:hypothetical protein